MAFTTPGTEGGKDEAEGVAAFLFKSNQSSFSPAEPGCAVLFPLDRGHGLKPAW